MTQLQPGGGARLSAETLHASTVANEGRAVLITGPSGSGRTTALAATAAALHRFSSASELHLMTPRRQSELLDLGVWAETAVGGEAATALATRLAADIEAGRITRPVAVAVAS